MMACGGHDWDTRRKQAGGEVGPPRQTQCGVIVLTAKDSSTGTLKRPQQWEEKRVRGRRVEGCFERCGQGVSESVDWSGHSTLDAGEVEKGHLLAMDPQA